MSIAVSGAAFQSVFRNSLVSSGILGVSNGAGFGACVSIICFGGGYSHLPAIVPMALGMLLIFLFRWRLNAHSMGEREAAAPGLDVRRCHTI